MPRLARACLHRGDGSSRNYSSDIVGRGLSGTESLHVAAMAEQMSIERETAATFLVTQLHAAVLRKKTISSHQPGLSPTRRPSWESVLLNVRLANDWKMVVRQEGASENPRSPRSRHQVSLRGSHIQNHINTSTTRTRKSS